MSLSKTFFIILIICIYYSADAVSVLSSEAILSGTPAPVIGFTYHVLIDAIQNFSLIHTPVGSGAIISDIHVVSSANVFLLSSGLLKERRFSVIAGTIDLSLKDIYRIDIDRMYFPSYDRSFLYFNLAVAKLKKDVGLGQTFFVSKLKLPFPGQSFQRSKAVVSGFGYIDIETSINGTSGQRIIVNGTLSSLLRFRNVFILSDNDCAATYAREITVNNICGIMHKEYDTDRVVGICYGDAGNPLVIGDILVGIVSTTTSDCDNTDKGALYTKVSSFVYNIQSLLADNKPTDAFFHINRPHILPKH